VLENDGFEKWAEDRVVVLVAHNELGHEEVEEETKEGEAVRRCTLYPGLACRDHLGIAVDIDNARGEGLVKVPFIELCPNSWTVSPTGEVTPIPEDDQFDPKRIREQVEGLQKGLGPILSRERFEKVTEQWDRVQPAIDEERWAEALDALSAAMGEAKEPQAPLRALVEAHLASIDEGVTFAFEEIRDDDARPLPERREAVRALLATADREVLGSRIPATTAMREWLGAP
jgi:hypothetical protein